jgi:DNA polymerase/3'-5' exonuclease PolX
LVPASSIEESKEEFKEIEMTVDEEEEEEVEEEVVEPEEEVEEVVEEEEEGMEVEKYFHRGRSYWRDTNSDKLYAVIDGDEVGDEVGALVGGKPQFLAA